MITMRRRAVQHDPTRRPTTFTHILFIKISQSWQLVLAACQRGLEVYNGLSR